MAGLIMVQTPDEVTAQRSEGQERPPLSSPDLPALITYFKSQWAIAKRRKEPIEREMLEAQRARAGEYSANEMEAINKIGGTDAYRNICDVKCRTGAAWIRDIIFQPGDDPFSIEPTPVPDLPEEIITRLHERVQSMAVDQAVMGEMQSGQPIDITNLKQQIEASVEAAMAQIGGELYEEARLRADKMMDVIKDQLTEAKFERAAARTIDDLTTYHVGILKGPVVRMRRELSWQDGVPTQTETAQPCVDRVHPLDFYPVNPYDIEFAGVYERHRWHPGKLQQLIGIEGYREEDIREILKENKTGNTLNTDSERDTANGINDHPDSIECFECWEAVRGEMLSGWGIEVDDMEKSYQIHAFMIGDRLIRVMLNPHPLGKRPYHLSSYVNGDSIWGRSIARLLKDSIKSANSVYRAAINNCAMAWGPMSEVNVSRLAQGESADIYPLKRFMTTDDQMSGVPAIRLTDIPYKGDAMFRALIEIEKRADDESGIPAYAHGSQDIGGAGKTSSGLSMLLGMATKTIKDVIRNYDAALEGLVEAFYLYNMEYHPNQDIKGDCKIKAKGSSALVIKEQTTIRLREFLAQTNNPTDMQITGLEGRAYALKEAAKGMNLEADKLVPALPEPQGITTQGQAPQGEQPEVQTLDAAGSPVGGQDNNLEVSGAA